MQAAGWQSDGSAPLTQLQRLQANRQRTLVLVIDQFEELLVGGTDADGQQTEADRFLAFLQELLGLRAAGLLVLATMRIDFMPLLQNRCPDLLQKAINMPLRPIKVEDFAELIEGPAARSGLDLETGLKERLVAESEGPDSLPLLAFTLEKLWRQRQANLLTLAAYEQLKGVFEPPGDAERPGEGGQTPRPAAGPAQTQPADHRANGAAPPAGFLRPPA